MILKLAEKHHKLPSEVLEESTEWLAYLIAYDNAQYEKAGQVEVKAKLKDRLKSKMH
jgi:hypothetical protein